MPSPDHFLTCLAAHAEKQPDKIALRVSTGASSPDAFTEHTYAQLHAAVLALSEQLRDIVAPGERALILMPSGAEFITAFLACLHAGIIAVPAYPPRRNRNRERVLSIHDDAQPAVILTTAAAEVNVREALPETKARVVATALGLRQPAAALGSASLLAGKDSASVSDVAEESPLRLRSPSAASRLADSKQRQQAAALHGVVSCGPPALDTRLTIHDRETGVQLDDEQEGEIHVHSPSVALGYWRNEAATAAAFPQSGTLRTGDLGFLHAGELYVTGRVKDLIIIRGRNLYPQDVETCVAAQLPSATGANSIAAFEFAGNGSGSGALGLLIEAPRAWVASVRKQDGEIASHIRRIREAVALTFEVTADLIAFVAPGDFPRTSSGKVQRGACRDGVMNGTLPVIYQDQLSASSDRVAVKDGSRGFKPTDTSNARIVSRSDTGTTAPTDGPNDDQRTGSSVATRRDDLAAANRGLKSTATFLDRYAVGERGTGILPVEMPGWKPDGQHGQDARATLQHIEHGLLDFLRREKLGNLDTVPHDATFSSLGIDSLGAASLAIEIEKTFGVKITDETLYDYPTLQRLAGYIESRHAPEGTPAEQGRAVWLATLSTMNERISRLEKEGNYFYEQPFEAQDSASVWLGGRRCVHLSSYSYLGFVADEEVRLKVDDYSRRLGCGSHGTRMLASTQWHLELEALIAKTLQSESAVTFGTGFVTNWAVISTLMSAEDTIIADEWIHASLVDGCKGSGATFTFFRHNNLEHLAELLAVPTKGKTLVVIDAVYSMEGDIAPVPEISALAHAHGAWLMVDEAHSLGVLGARGLGIQEHFGLPPDAIDIKMGTLSKAIPSAGGYIAGSTDLIAALRHNVRPFIFSGAPTPPMVAAAMAGFEILLSQPERVRKLHANIRFFRDGLRSIGLTPPETGSAILPLMCRDEESTFTFAKRCLPTASTSRPSSSPPCRRMPRASDAASRRR